MKKKLFAATMFFLIGFSIQSRAEFYKWVDEKGVTRISNTGVPEQYKEKVSKSEETKYIGQPRQAESPKENVTIINNIPPPVVINNAQATPIPKDNIDEMVKLEHNRLQELMKDRVDPFNGRSYRSEERESWKHSESKRKDKVKKNLDLLNKDPNQYFHDKPENDRREEAEENRKAIRNASPTIVNVPPPIIINHW